jgi:hypothetical protein
VRRENIPGIEIGHPLKLAAVARIGIDQISRDSHEPRP